MLCCAVLCCVRWLLRRHCCAVEQKTALGQAVTLTFLPIRLGLRLQEEHAAAARERDALRQRTDALQMTLMQSAGQQGVLSRESSPEAVLKKVR